MPELEALNKIIAAWERLHGGRYTPSEVERWLRDDMSPAINYARSVIAITLAEAMLQLLDDMGNDGLSVCLLSKAQARIAYEPFRDPIEETYIMPLDEATRIIDACKAG